MLVSCPKCTSRYQLSDDKIRSTGTKVRCPRCQNTFRVFKPEPEQVQEDLSEDRTELFIRRVPAKTVEPTVTKKEVPKETAASRSQTEIQPQSKTPSPFKYEANEEDVEDGIVEASAEFPGFQTTPPEAHMPTQISVRPFAKDPAKSDKVKKEAESESNPEESSEESSESTSAPRPFGDATFLAIQKMGSGKTGKRKVLIAASLAIIFLGGFFLMSRGPSSDPSQISTISPAQIAAVTISRPDRWYQDEPEVYQRFLSQMATLPVSERGLPKNKALIAEALILNGILTGNYDQVAEGMGFASALITSRPSEIYGLYALSTYATFKDDTSTLMGLTSRWPESNRRDVEYKLAFILSGVKGGKKIEALEMAKSLLSESQGMARAETVALAAALESWNEANQILGEKNLSDLVRAFQKRKQGLERNGIPLPELYSSVEKKLLRRQQVAKAEAKVETQPEPKPAPKVEPKKVEEPKPAPAPQATGESITERLNRRAAERMQAKQQKAIEVPKKPAQLPRPTSALIATNKQAKQEQSEAAKLYNQGLELLKGNKQDDAVVAFQKALRFDPDFADSYRKLGEIYMSRSDKERALRSFKIYLQLKPDSTDKQLVEGWISSLQ